MKQTRIALQQFERGIKKQRGRIESPLSEADSALLCGTRQKNSFWMEFQLAALPCFCPSRPPWSASQDSLVFVPIQSSKAHSWVQTRELSQPNEATLFDGEESVRGRYAHVPIDQDGHSQKPRGGREEMLVVSATSGNQALIPHHDTPQSQVDTSQPTEHNPDQEASLGQEAPFHSGSEETKVTSIRLTKAAIRRLQFVNSERKAKSLEPYCLRLHVEGGGCAGFHYEFQLETDSETRAHEGRDMVFGEDENRLLVDKAFQGIFEDCVVDFQEALIGSQFVILQNKAAAGSCNCGHSFEVPGLGF